MDTNFHLKDTVFCNPAFYPFDRDTITGEWPPYCIEVSRDNIILGSTVETNVFALRPEFRWGVLKYNLSSRSVTGCGAFPINPDTLAYRSFTYGGCSMALSGKVFYTLGVTGGFGWKGFSVVAKYDTSGKPLWIRYLGDRKRRSWSRSIVVCRDGSVLLNAYSDSASDFYDNYARAMDFYVVRLDSATGDPLSVINVSEQLRSGIVLFPNPAEGNISFKGLKERSIVTLSDISGRDVLTRYVWSESDQIPVADLIPGIYMYAIRSESGVLISHGQWVKR